MPISFPIRILLLGVSYGSCKLNSVRIILCISSLAERVEDLTYKSNSVEQSNLIIYLFLEKLHLKISRPYTSLYALFRESIKNSFSFNHESCTFSVIPLLEESVLEDSVT
jgi:hypothetical protein